jgi:exoribonuclease II
VDKSKDTQVGCSLRETDEEGHPNLCCCYIIDEDGNIDDPCYHPVEACC